MNFSGHSIEIRSILTSTKQRKGLFTQNFHLVPNVNREGAKFLQLSWLLHVCDLPQWNDVRKQQDETKKVAIPRSIEALATEKN